MKGDENKKKVVNIYTHQRPDFDAVASGTILKAKILPSTSNTKTKLWFVPADWDGKTSTIKTTFGKQINIPLPQEGDWILDLDCGIKGELDPQNTRHSCAKYLYDHFVHNETDRKILWKLVTIAELIDTRGGNVIGEMLRIDHTDEVAVLNAFSINSIYYNERNARHLNDIQSYNLLAGWMLHHIENEQKRLHAAENLKEKEENVTWFHHNEIALLESHNYGIESGILFHQGAKIVIYADPDQNKIGALRKTGVEIKLNDPIVKSLTEGEEGWHFTDDGRSCSYNSAKSTQRPQQTKVTPSRLVATITTLLENQKKRKQQKALEQIEQRKRQRQIRDLERVKEYTCPFPVELKIPFDKHWVEEKDIPVKGHGTKTIPAHFKFLYNRDIEIHMYGVRKNIFHDENMRGCVEIESKKINNRKLYLVNFYVGKQTRFECPTTFLITNRDFSNGKDLAIFIENQCTIIFCEKDKDV